MTCSCAKGRRCLACMDRDGLTKPSARRSENRIFDLWYAKASIATRLRYWNEVTASRRRNAEAEQATRGAEAS